MLNGPGDFDPPEYSMNPEDQAELDTATWVMERAQDVAAKALDAIQAAAIVNNLELTPDTLEIMLEGICEALYEQEEVSNAHSALNRLPDTDESPYPPDHKNLCKRVSFVIQDAIRAKHPRMSDLLFSGLKPKGGSHGEA